MLANTNPAVGDSGVRNDFQVGQITNSQAVESTQVEFLVSLLRAASLRFRLAAVELDSIGTALRGQLITYDAAVEWLDDVGLFDQVVSEVVQ